MLKKFILNSLLWSQSLQRLSSQEIPIRETIILHLMKKKEGEVSHLENKIIKMTDMKLGMTKMVSMTEKDLQLVATLVIIAVEVTDRTLRLEEGPSSSTDLMATNQMFKATITSLMCQGIQLWGLSLPISNTNSHRSKLASQIDLQCKDSYRLLADS